MKNDEWRLTNDGIAAIGAPNHNFGNIFAVLFFYIRTLSNEWIRSLVSFFDRIDRINGIFFACGEVLLGRRPFYPDDPVNPV